MIGPATNESGFVHATALVLGEAGVVIFGPSGAGKSALALALIEGSAPGTFARLIGDDRVHLAAHGTRLLVAGHPRIAGQIERRGQGIETLASEPSAVVRLVVELSAPDMGSPRLPDDLSPYRHGDAAVRRLAVGPGPVATQAQAVRAALTSTAEM